MAKRILTNDLSDLSAKLRVIHRKLDRLSNATTVDGYAPGEMTTLVDASMDVVYSELLKLQHLSERVETSDG